MTAPPSEKTQHEAGTAEAVRDVYARNAETYVAQRSRALHEARWLQRFVAALPDGASVLDLGCGDGQPITDWLSGEGYRVTGADFTAELLDLAKARRPDGDWRLVDMRALDLAERFDGIVAWNSFFHLTPDEQRACLPRLASHLSKGGVLMVTVGPGEGETTGEVAGEEVYHASLSPTEYATILSRAGLRMTAYMAEDPDCAAHGVLMARDARTE